MSGRAQPGFAQGLPWKSAFGVDVPQFLLSLRFVDTKGRFGIPQAVDRYCRLLVKDVLHLLMLWDI